MDKEERYVFVYNSYDVDEFVYDNKDRLRIDSLNKCCNVLNWKEDKITDLETKLADSEKEHELLIDNFEEETENLRKQIKQESDARKRFIESNKQLKQQLTETDKLMQEYLSKCLSLEQQLAEKDAEVQSWKDGTMVVKLGKLEEQLTDKEKLHLLDEKEWQDYCAYKIIEPQIKGCLDRERTYLNFFENFETNVNLIIAHNPRLDKCGIVKEIIYYVEQQLKSVKGEINNE